MSTETIKVLRALAKDKGEYVFESSTGQQPDTDTIRKALIDVAKAAGISGLTRVHDLRHTFNSLMQMNGVDPATMGKILGHKDIETTTIYTHQTEEHLKRSANKVGIRLGGHWQKSSAIRRPFPTERPCWPSLE